MKVYKREMDSQKFISYTVSIEVDSTKDRRMLEQFFGYLDTCKHKREHINERWFPTDTKYGDLNTFYEDLRRLLLPE